MNKVDLLPKLMVYASPRKNEKRLALLSVFPKLSPQDRCLDIGTSHGGLAAFFSRCGHWTYVDLDASNLAVAKKFLCGEFVENDVLEYLKQGEKFKLITCLDTLMYFDHYEILLSKTYEALEENGVLIISGVNETKNSFAWFLRKVFGLTTAHGFCHDLPFEKVANQLQCCGFYVEKRIGFFGPIAFLMQTILDRIVLNSSVNTGDRLTQNISTTLEKLEGKIFFLKGLRVINFFGYLLDRLLFFLPRYGYVLRAKRELIL